MAPRVSEAAAAAVKASGMQVRLLWFWVRVTGGQPVGQITG